jgi:hypothetical protein
MAVTLLQDLAALYTSIPFQWKLVAHCLVVSSWFQMNKNKFLLSYWTGFLGAFGGGILSALVLQAPQRAGVALFEDNSIGITWTLCWWGMNYSPGDVVNRVHSLLPVRMVTKICMNMLRAGIIAQRVDISEEMFPGVVAAALFIGTVAASGGKLLVDLIQHFTGELKGASEVTEPGFPLRTGFFGSLLYWLTVHFFGVLKPLEGMALVTTIFIAHGIAADLTGRPVDFTYPLAWVLHGATGVPMPGAQPRKQPAVTPSKKTK